MNVLNSGTRKSLRLAGTIGERNFKGETMKTALAWIRNIVVEVPAIAFQGFHKAEKAALERTAERIRSLAAKYDSEARPLILSEPETCPACDQRSMMFIWPYKFCVGCWKKALNHRFDVARISQLSFWSELVKFTETYRDNDEFQSQWAQSDVALTINLKSVSPKDRKHLSKIENPAEAIARQIDVLIASNNLTDKLEVMLGVKREEHLLHLCPVS
jgi:hypothetical protein